MGNYNFYEAYVGPPGPHLNYVSKYTLTRKEEDRLRGDSIHPRNWLAGSGKKVNTSKASTGQRQRRSAAAIAAHLERHPNDKLGEARLATLSSPEAA